MLSAASEAGFWCAGAAIAVAMPMTPESVAIYLGIILSGCAAVSIADSFAPSEIASRLKISQAALIFTQVHAFKACHASGAAFPFTQIHVTNGLIRSLLARFSLVAKPTMLARM